MTVGWVLEDREVSVRKWKVEVGWEKGFRDITYKALMTRGYHQRHLTIPSTSVFTAYYPQINRILSSEHWRAVLQKL